jgi:hypothetical protein
MARQDYRAAAWISSSEAVLAAFLEIECVVVQFAYALEVIGVHLDGIGCSVKRLLPHSVECSLCSLHTSF